MDITINIEDYRLNVRAACIITHNNKILVHNNINDDYYAVLGGRVKIGEDSETTLKREILEEIGKKIDITGYIATIENFYEANELKSHEYMFVYEAEFTDEQDKKIQETIKNIEGDESLNYVWLDLDKIDEYVIKPKVIKNILKEGRFPVHKINKDT